MRILLAIALSLILLGCVTEEGGTGNAPPSQTAPPSVQFNKTNGTNQTTNESESVPVQANESANITISENVTAAEPVPGQENATPDETAGTKNISGIPFGDGAYILVLDDLSVPDGEACALLSIWNATAATLMTKMEICPGEEQNWIAPDGRVFRIKVLKTAAGYTQTGKWASVVIYG